MTPVSLLQHSGNRRLFNRPPFAGTGAAAPGALDIPVRQRGSPRNPDSLDGFFKARFVQEAQLLTKADPIRHLIGRKR
jgi:hypothetical protein